MSHIANNKNALFHYQILEKLEAGIVLTGAEVKSAKLGQINLKGSYVSINKGVPWLIKCHISPYKMAGSQKNYEPTRPRKLLLKKSEISSLIGRLSSAGLTLIPVSVYTKGGFIKLEIGLAKGKKEIDKREKIKKREVNRRIQRIMRNKI